MSTQLELADLQEPRLPAMWAWSKFSLVARIASNLVDPNGFPNMPHIAPNHIERDTGRLLPYNTIAKDGVTSGKHRFYAGQILYSKIRPYLNKCMIARFGGLCSADMYPVDAHIDAGYLCHYMLTRAFVDAVSAAAGSRTVLPKTNQKQMADVLIPVPPLPEQHRIVAEIEKQFTRLDAAVASLERVKANLKRARASVLKAAVEGRLVPTDASLAQAEGRDYEPASVLLERILEERQRKHEEAQEGAKQKKKYKPPVEPDTEELPKLPDGWAYATVDQLAHTVKYGTSAKCSTDDLGVPVLRMGNIENGRISYEGLKFLPSDHEEFPDQFLTPGEVLFNRTNSPELVGKTAVFKEHSRPVACASYLIRVVLLTGVEPEHLAYCINSLRGRFWIRSVVTQQVGQANVNGTKLRKYVVPLPPSAEQVRLVAEVERRLSVIDALSDVIETNLARCSRLRQSILKRAFEGKLVPQDPNDEPASELLARIQAEAEAAKPKRTKKKSTRKKAAKKKATRKKKTTA